MARLLYLALATVLATVLLAVLVSAVFIVGMIVVLYLFDVAQRAW